jgi:hypothetical protein
MMSKKKKPAYGVGQVVQGDIITMTRIDCSKWIGDKSVEEWTRGPVRPVTAVEQPTEKREHEPAGRKKRTGRK